MVAGLALMLTGCQVNLYSNLTEADANQIMAVLMANGVDASKVAAGKEGFTVTVDKEDMLRAIALLEDIGLPREKGASLGKVFERSGIMSSPFEERVRYISALGEEVAHTLEQIDGVITARVHIVLPEAPQLGQPLRPSSAAVFVKHQPSVDLDFFVPRIRRLVSSSIEGLNYDAVTVVLTAATSLRPTITPSSEPALVQALPGIMVRPEDADRVRMYAWVGAGLMAAIGIVIGALLLLFLKRKPRKPKATGTEVAAVEP
jgi:type III secretion protein J